MPVNGQANELDISVAELFIDTDPMGPHRITPQIARGEAGPGMEGEEYMTMASHMEQRLLGEKGILTLAINMALSDESKKANK